MYADTVTRSMRAALLETNRRREIQDRYNKEHGIIPKTVVKGVRDIIEIGVSDEQESKRRKGGEGASNRVMSAAEKERMIELMTKEMKEAARKLEFEQAAFLRDQIQKLREGKINAPQKTHTRRKK